MSADIWITAASTHECDCDQCPVEPETLAEMNLTYNLTPMLAGAGMPPWRSFIGLKANEAGLMWEAVVDELLSDPPRYRALNPPNGWGDYDGAVSTLTRFAQECAEAPVDAVIGGWL